MSLGVARWVAYDDDGRLLVLLELPDHEPRLGPSFFETKDLAPT